MGNALSLFQPPVQPLHNDGREAGPEFFDNDSYFGPNFLDTTAADMDANTTQHSFLDPRNALERYLVNRSFRKIN